MISKDKQHSKSSFFFVVKQNQVIVMPYHFQKIEKQNELWNINNIDAHWWNVSMVSKGIHEFNIFKDLEALFFVTQLYLQRL